ncbi:MAG: hypothetical protein RLZZ568_2052 [Cyanobacteriota bacterium]
MEKGTLIEFRHQGERRLAVIDRPEGKKDWVVIDVKGQSYKLKPQRIEYEVKGGPYHVDEITAFSAEVDSYCDPSSLEVAWELLSEEGESVTPEDLALLLFSEQSPAQCYAAHLLLAEDKIYFKQKGDRHEPRSAAQIEEIKHQLAVKAQKEQEHLGFVTRIKAALAGETVTWQASDRHRLESLERYVLFPEQTHRQAQEVLQSIDKPCRTDETQVLLIELGIWQRHENLFLRRSAYPSQFPAKVTAVAHDRLTNPPVDPDPNRLDLSHLKTYTIDDESTSEIDDGLSVETLADGQYRLWIHVADPTRLMSPNDELDLEARKRSTSLYLPTGLVSMFPPELATGPMSLLQGKRCPALSFGVILDAAGAVQDFQIAASWVKPTYRLTYDDVDEMLVMGIQDESEITVLAQAAKQRGRWRKSQGAITIKMPEAVIKVDQADDVQIYLLETSVSRQLVAEMMILAGEVAGRFCQAENIPVPFRGQPQPELPPDEELLQLPAGPVRECAVRRCMPRSEVGITPSRHASLGLDVYSQATSPIRRYTDMLTHFQIKAYLRGDRLPFTRDEMQQILFSVMPSSKEASLVERQTNRYWGLEFLRRNVDEVWQGLMLRWLREDDGLGLILLEELGLELPHRFDRPIAPGDRLSLKVSKADPHRDEIRFRELLPNEA